MYCASVELLLGKKIGNLEVSSDSWPLLSSGNVLLLFSGRTLAVESPQFSAGENFSFPFRQDAMQDLPSGCHNTLGTFSGEGEMHLH